MKEIFVKPGEQAFYQGQAVLLSALVGVSVTVCLWDAKHKRSGMCHYRLPVANADSNTAKIANEYGSEAIAALLKKFTDIGSKLQSLQATVIGGAELECHEFIENRQTAARNIAVALGILAEFNIPVLGEFVGGALHRQVQFNAATGEVSFQAIHSDDFCEATSHLQPVTIASTAEKLIKVLVIDSSPSIRNLLQSTIEQGGEFKVIAQASNIQVARQMIEKHTPDVITLDIDSNETQWLGFIESYIQQYQIPMLIVTSLQQHACENIFAALNLGVIDYIDKSSLTGIHAKLKAVYQSRQYLHHSLLLSKEQAIERKSFDASLHDSTLVLLGASTGGVDALEVVLKKLPASSPPICIVQHMPNEYTGSLASRLNAVCDVTVCEAVDGIEVLKNHVYIAHGGNHLKVLQLDTQKLVLRLTGEEPNNGFKPSVDTLFQSAKCIKGWNLVAVLLTGMGRDGAQGLLELKRQGCFTIVQNEASSVVYGMAKVATEIGAVCKTTSISGISTAIIEAVITGENQPRHIDMEKPLVEVHMN